MLQILPFQCRDTVVSSYWRRNNTFLTHAKEHTHTHTHTHTHIFGHTLNTGTKKIILLCQVHREIAFDSSLRSKCTTHTSKSLAEENNEQQVEQCEVCCTCSCYLPAGENSRCVYLCCCYACCLLDQLTEYLMGVVTNI